MLDRIDIQFEVPAVPFKELSARQPGTSSSAMREEVTVARRAQTDRFRNSRTRVNALMTHREIRQHCQLDEAGQSLLKATMTEMGLSARAHDKILRVARTIADLEATEAISPAHVSEAINYRLLDRGLWK